MRNRIDWSDLVARHWNHLAGRKVKNKEATRQLRKVALPLSQGRHGGIDGFTLAVAEALVVSEKESPVLYDRAAECSAELILLEGLNRVGRKVAGIHGVVSEKFP